MGIFPIRRRAVRDEQKEERRQAIIDAAWQLFQRTSYDALTIAEVAETLGLAKGTVFLYFKTKEALFMAIVEQQLAAWFAEVDAGLAALDAPAAIPTVADMVGQALDRRPGLVRLLAILHTILECNIDLDTAVQFKRFLRNHFFHTGKLLERCLPFLQAGAGAHVLLQSYALVIGFWHLADPAPVMREALQQPDLRLFEIQFAPEFYAALQALWYGLERAASAESLQKEQQ